MSTSPRPILKHHPNLSDQHHLLHPSPFPFAACSTVLLSPHVHFPPTPTLTSTFTTHSPTSYDRTPLVVAPNNCALPGRHEREFTEGRTRAEYESLSSRSRSSRREEMKGSYFHPRAYEACYSPEPPSPSSSSSALSSSLSSTTSTSTSTSSGYPPPPFSSRPPPLIPDSFHYDVSSESDDSDGLITTPPDPTTMTTTPRAFPQVCLTTTHESGADGHSIPVISPYSHAQEEIGSALSFLTRSSSSTSRDMHTRTPLSLKERRRAKGTHTTARSGKYDKRNDHFEVSSLDEGCLGGF